MDYYGRIGQCIVSALVLVSFLGTVGALFWVSFREKDFPPGVKETLLVLVGVLAGAFKDVVGFWIGSSYGSARKTEILAKP